LRSAIRCARKARLTENTNAAPASNSSLSSGASKASIIAESLLDGECQRLTMRAIELALSGDLQALKMCLERILAMPQLPTPVRPSYAYATMGEFIAWIIGWDLILEYAFGATTVAIGCYVTSFLCAGLEIPARFSVAPLAYDPAVGTWSPPGALFNLPAIFIIILITILLVVGIRESAKVNNVIVAIKLVIIVVFILAGVWFVKASNWVTPSSPTGAFIPPNIGPGQFGWSGIIPRRGGGLLCLYRF
jgi:hypothetical protein